VTSSSRVSSSFFWSAVERFGQQIATFVIQVILARLLGPEEFGLVAMVGIFLAIAGVLVDSGLGHALIQRRNVTDADCSTAFYSNFGIAILVYVILVLNASWISEFFGQVELLSLLPILALVIPVGALGNVQAALLTRQMAFRRLCYVSIPSVFLGGAVGIGLAYTGFGVWALVFQRLSQRSIYSILLFVFSNWRPTFCFSVSSFRHLFGFGSKLMLSGILNQGFHNAYGLVIGKLYAPSDLGLFQRARAFQELPVNNLQKVMTNVSFPLFSSLQDQPNQLRTSVLQWVRFSVLLAFPAMAGLAAISKPMIRLLLGAQWLEAAPLLTVFCLAGLLFPISSICVTAILAKGRSGLVLKLELWKKLFIIINLLVASWFGIYALALGIVAVAGISLLFNLGFASREIGFGIRQCVLCLIGPAGATLLMLIPCILLRFVVGSPLLLVCLAVSIAPISYLLALFALRQIRITDLEVLSPYLPQWLTARLRPYCH